MGVDIFFVISGFVVTGSLLRKQSPSAFDFLATFYSRRIRRLAPALLVMIFATSLGIAILCHPDAVGPDEYLSTAQFALVGWTNNLLATKGRRYGDDGPEALEYHPLMHTWSLGVEEQFYFLFPMLIMLAFGSRITSRTVCPTLASFSPVKVLTVTLALSLIASTYFTITWQEMAFYLLLSRFWQLMAGAILYVWQEPANTMEGRAMGERRSTPSLFAVFACEFAIALVTSLAVVLSPLDHGFPVPWSGLAITGALGYIALGSPSLVEKRCVMGCIPSPFLNSLLGCRIFAYVGRLSYPLYLFREAAHASNLCGVHNDLREELICPAKVIERMILAI